MFPNACNTRSTSKYRSSVILASEICSLSVKSSGAVSRIRLFSPSTFPRSDA